MNTEHQTILKATGITKIFAGTVALDGIDFELRAGEVHAVVGENGAGKSTLMKVLSGVYAPDGGEIEIDGAVLDPGKPMSSVDAGISMIHQELSNLPKLSVAENIFLGRLPSNWLGLVDFRQIVEKTQDYFDRYKVEINPQKKLANLSVAEKQFVEIIKATQASDARIVIMDEPTSSLSKEEVVKLFRIIEALKADGKTIVYISHRLDEIAEIADRVSVFRDGKNRGVLTRGDFHEEKIIEMMIGHSIGRLDKTDGTTGRNVLEVKDLNIPGKVKDFNLELREGEILGIAGLMGSGKDPMVKALFGLWPTASMRISHRGKPIGVARPSDAIREGIVYLPEERKTQALFLDLSVSKNITPAWIFHKYRRWFINEADERRVGNDMINTLSIKTASDETLIKNLSGGNQQKAVFGRLLLLNPDIMVLNDPTRGVDVGSKEEIYAQIRKLAQSGTSIILVSSELEEIEYLSNRVVVLSKGEICGKYSDSDVTMENLLLCVTRAKND